MKNSDITDPLFLKAIEAIDSGDTELLKQLLNDNPRLVRDRLNLPEEGYFKDPYLLWFVADNPIRNGKLPQNIAEITRLIIDELQKQQVNDFKDQIDYTLGLVATGRIPRESGMQIELIDLLIDTGATPGGGLGALANGNIEAARHLIKRGGKLTLAAAVGLDLKDDVARLMTNATDREKQSALLVASFYGKADMISLLIEHGVDVNKLPKDGNGFHSHASPLHQAVFSGSLESVKLLVEAGADLNATDRIYNGTPVGWAIHMQTETTYSDEARKKFKKIEEYLNEISKS